MKILVLDQSVLYQQSIRAINSNTHELKFDDLKREYAIGYFKKIMWFKTIFNPDLTYFMRDSKPYWRTQVMEDHYNKPGRVRISKAVDSDIYYLNVSHAVRRYSLMEGQWVVKKLTIKEIDEMEPHLPVGKHQVPSAAFAKMDREIPGYKKKRGLDRKWPFPDDDEDEIKQTERNICKAAAPYLNGVIVERAKLEADDLAAAVKRVHPHDFITYASLDMDWTQLTHKHLPDIFFNLYNYQFEPKTGVLLDLWLKIFCGDTSDEYKGVTCLSGKKPMFYKKPKIEEHFANGGSSLLSQIGNDPELTDVEEFQRNLTLASFVSSPESVKRAAYNAIKEAKPEQPGYEYKPEDFGWCEEDQDELDTRKAIDRIALSNQKRKYLDEWKTCNSHE
jgi:hypothetical protein